MEQPPLPLNSPTESPQCSSGMPPTLEGALGHWAAEGLPWVIRDAAGGQQERQAEGMGRCTCVGRCAHGIKPDSSALSSRLVSSALLPPAPRSADVY